MVPKDAIKKLGIELKPENKYEFIGSDGSRDLYEIAQLELIFVTEILKGSF
ncbi:MAG: hypothetical protein ACE5I1_09665 [bacterium]